MTTETAKPLSCGQAARLIKGELKKAYPGQKFKVTSHLYRRRADAGSIEIEWIEGPAQNEVERLAKRFEGADFDPLADSLTMRADAISGADFIFCRRLTTKQAQALADYDRFKRLLKGVKLGASA